MERINNCPACTAQRNKVKTRIALEHTCGRFARKPHYSGINEKDMPIYTCGRTPENYTDCTIEPLSKAQQERAARLWIAAIVDSAGFPLFGNVITQADAQAIAAHVKKLMADFAAPGSTAGTDTATIIRYVKRYIK